MYIFFFGIILVHNDIQRRDSNIYHSLQGQGTIKKLLCRKKDFIICNDRNVLKNRKNI